MGFLAFGFFPVCFLLGLLRHDVFRYLVLESSYHVWRGSSTSSRRCNRISTLWQLWWMVEISLTLGLFLAIVGMLLNKCGTADRYGHFNSLDASSGGWMKSS